MLLSSLCVFCPEMLTSKMISSCFPTCLCNGYLKDHLHCLLTPSPVTRHHSVTHIKSDVNSPIHPRLILPSSLGDCGAVVCMCGSLLFRSGPATANSVEDLLVSSELHRHSAVIQWPAAYWCGVALCGGRHLLLSFCKIPSSHGFIYAEAFSYQEKRGEKCSQTHKLCPNDNRGNAITGNTFTTSPAWARSGCAACEPQWEDEPVLPNFPVFWWSL